MPTHYQGYLGHAKNKACSVQINWGSFPGRREESWGSFQGRYHFGVEFGDHLRFGYHFGVGIILGAVQIACNHPRKTHFVIHRSGDRVFHWSLRILTCEQALCLGRGWKNCEEREGTLSLPSPRDFLTLSSNREPVHRLELPGKSTREKEGGGLSDQALWSLPGRSYHVAKSKHN